MNATWPVIAVDDEAQMRQAMQQTLELADFEVWVKRPGANWRPSGRYRDTRSTAHRRRTNGIREL